jgi:opacity protein-like surface antigen
MNKLVKLSAIALLSMTTSLMAQKSFQGTSVALTTSVVGAEAKGNVVSPDRTGNADSGSIGRIGALAGVDAAYTIGAGTNGFFGFGATYIPIKAELATATGGKNDEGTSSTNTGKAEIKDYYTLYIQPGYAINNTAAIYAKALYASAKLDVSGATSTSKTLEGWGGGIGLKTFLDKNLFIQTELNYTEFDSVKVTGTGNLAGTVTAKPKIAGGTINIGYQF